ncbi:glycosyltransferase [Myceligenerans sp. TRM 65318]|uniref:Glycosyltransferase n=1 Tax=Myceligenerans pegani TaxID=2776917 RepID=A0ABR9MYE5_9MICO|nr:glycosyltransferase [Myceligenerans sp. TRM 65318]MBE1876394.1 glycosyltransferase [Myceligenerans sp. TRM 65318]MBE3018665.1 glycosyltransferase [Myceligenerans sp. TRM 65318]
MTSPPTGLPPHRPTDTALAAVRSVTGAVPALVTVTAVVVTRGRSPFLEATLAAVRAQSPAPRQIVVVDVETAPSTSEHQGLSLDGARYVAASHSRSFGDAVNAAVAGLSAPGDAPASDWLWLLHDDSAPAPGALAALLRSVEHTSTVAVAGCKQRRWEVDDDGRPRDPAHPDRGVLLQVGYTVSPLGRRMTGLDESEIDQGQHDSREDVLAVGLAGALVRTSVWCDLDGTDAEYGPFGDSLEFCRRVRLAGHRVTVVPGAVVRHAQQSLADPSNRSRMRRGRLRFQLVATSPWLLGWAMLAVVAGAPVRAAFRLAVKQPAAARDELMAPLWMLLGLSSVLRARRRTARSATQPYRVLRPLLGTWRQTFREFRERRLARADARYTGPDDLDREDLRRIATRRRAVLALVLVAVTGVAAAVFGPVLGTLADGGRLVGGALLPASSDTGQVWTAATSGWVRSGIGEAGPGDPLLLTLTVLSLLAGGSLQTGVHALFVVALPLAALGGWAAAGAVTRSVWVRAVAAFAWAAAPPLLGALSGGLLGALVAHLTLPWVALALVRSVGAQRIDLPARSSVNAVTERPVLDGAFVEEGRGHRLGAAGAAGLMLAVAVSGAPVLLPIAVVVLAGAAFAAPSRRIHLALAALPSVVACAPLLVQVARTRDLGLLLADPLAPPGTFPIGEAAGWEVLLGQASAPVAWLGGAWPGTELGPYLLGGLLCVVALVALAGPRAAGARVGWILAACGLAVVVLADGGPGGPGASGPGAFGLDTGLLDGRGSGTALASVVLLGLGGAALCTTRAVRARRAARTVAVAGVAVPLVIGLVSAAGLASWCLADPLSDDGVHATARPAVPAVGQQMQAAPRQARVLQLGTGGDGVVEYALLRGDGTQLVDASVAGSAVATAAPAAGTRREAGSGEDAAGSAGSGTDADFPAASTQDAVDDVAVRLAAGNDPDVAERLAALGIGAVQVPTPDASDDAADGSGRVAGNAELTASLDMIPDVERVTQGQPVTLWRVRTEQDPTPGWARIEDGRSTTQVASGGPSVHVDVAPGDAGRRVVLAESADPHWSATLDGRRLEPVEVHTAGATLQAFELGPDGGRLDIGYHAPHRTAWLVALGLVGAVFALLALPVRGRRPR